MWFSRVLLATPTATRLLRGFLLGSFLPGSLGAVGGEKVFHRIGKDR